MEPFFEAETDEEGGVWVDFVEFHDGWVGEVVVVAVGYYDEVDGGDVFDVAGDLGVPLGTHEGEGTAAVFEDGVEEDAETAGEFDVVAGVAEPCCSEGIRGGSGGEKGGLDDGHGWGRGIGVGELSCESPPV